ncbi:hypothetical protein [Pseudarthrobacter equi]|uniref:hypothetical protein n=1 Tax=Pseudarthrobacter equi TaxID=728066 RepID=UPI0028D5892A|nr:hypothetical protein [Pseudarthrobacter equi]
MGNYNPPAGEYVRPPGKIWLEPKTGLDNHFVRGAAYQKEMVAKYGVGVELAIELVPEPSNPYDRWAVALHVEHKRIGYVSAEDSGRWHDIAVAYNRRGLAVFAKGETHRYGEGVVGAAVFLPGYLDLERLMFDLGLYDECDAVIAALPHEARGRILSEGRYGLDEADVRLLRSLKHLAPSLNWRESVDSRFDNRYPTALYRRLIEIDQLERKRLQEEEAIARQAAKLERERIDNEKRTAAAEARSSFVEDVVNLHAAGQSLAAMGRHLGCSDSKIKRALAERGIFFSSQLHQDAKDERYGRARQALQMQKDGFTRKEIAAEMSCSFETVKALLKDAKFYADPFSDTARLLRVKESRDETLKGLGYDTAAGMLNTTTAKVKEWRRDFSILANLYPNLLTGSE